MSVDTTRAAPAPPFRRILALALAVAVLALIAGGFIAPMARRYAALDGAITESTVALRRLDAAAARLPQLERQKMALAAALAEQDGFLRGSDDSLIAAELQSRIKHIIDRAGGELRSTQILAPRDENGFRAFTARVQLICSADALEQIWYQADRGAPFLFIDDFDIEGRQTPRLDRTRPPMIVLDVRFDATAYARRGAQR